LEYSRAPEDFERRLKALGYQFIRSDDKYRHLSVKAPDWKRPIRLDSLGYTKDIINARLEEHQEDMYFYLVQNEHPRYKPKRYPLYDLEREFDFEINHSHDTAVVLVDILFYIFLQLLLLAKDENAQEQRRQPLSPSIRMEVAKLNQIQKEYLLLADNNIHSAEELSLFMDDISGQVKAMEEERQHYRNLLRRPKSPEVEVGFKQKCKDLSRKMKPLWDKLHTAEKIVERYPKLQKLLETEHQMEKDARSRERGR